MSGKKGMRQTVKWNDATCQLVLATARKLQSEGMLRPWIRAVLYRLLDVPGWTKAHYNTLTKKTGEWRDAGLIPYGLFTDSNMGAARSRPYTPKEIARQVELWEDKDPAVLPKDGYLRALMVEHVALVDQIEQWCGGVAFVVSSGGQVRRENLYTAVREWTRVVKELHGKGIKVWGLVDYDRGGGHIFEAHRVWFKDIAGLKLEHWGLTAAQVKHLGLSIDEDQQIDGAVGRDPVWFKNQIRKLLLADTEVAL